MRRIPALLEVAGLATAPASAAAGPSNVPWSTRSQTFRNARPPNWSPPWLRGGMNPDNRSTVGSSFIDKRRALFAPENQRS